MRGIDLGILIFLWASFVSLFYDYNHAKYNNKCFSIISDKREKHVNIISKLACGDCKCKLGKMNEKNTHI